MSRTHYEVLGAPRDATAAQLRQAYLARARQLHPDQFAGRPPDERAVAERKMQDLTAAWSVLSDPGRRRAYDASLGSSTRGTGRIVSGRHQERRPFHQPGPAPPRRKPQPRVADEREMEIRGPAKLLRPLPLVALLAAVAALIVVSITFTGGDDGPDTPGAPQVLPTGTPIGCIDLLPVAEQVPCGGHDAVVWAVVDANEGCPAELEAVYRQSLGGLFCVTRVE